MRSNKVRRESATATEETETVLGDDEVRRLRYETKLDEDGSALNPDRDSMYDDLTDVGESGTQGSEIGREDQNKIGPNGQP
jgi:hypothetical protein